MDFKEATDAVCDGLGHEDISKALGVSLQTVRQARLADGASARREPPKDWHYGLIRLAEKRIMHYRSLIDQLRREGIR